MDLAIDAQEICNELLNYGYTTEWNIDKSGNILLFLHHKNGIWILKHTKNIEKDTEIIRYWSAVKFDTVKSIIDMRKGQRKISFTLF